MSIKRVGVAGYMGAGKSTCMQFLTNENTVLIDADHHAKWLMENDRIIKDLIFTQFGKNVKENNTINFKELGKIAFSSLTELKKLNKIVHPPLIAHLKDLVLKQGLDTTIKKIVLDAALIPLWSIECWFDELLWIESSHEIRFNRLAKKSKGQIGLDELEHRMKLQEALFDSPDKNKWTIVQNDADVKDIEIYLQKFK